MPLSPPSAAPIHQVLPSEPLLLMGAGPTPIPHAVSRANGVVINHLGTTMNTVVEGVKDLARYAFQTDAEHVLGVAGPASAAMEMGLANLLWPGRRALCVVQGTFSIRMAEMATGLGAEVHRLEVPMGRSVDVDDIRAALATHGADLVTLVQGETSSGVQNQSLDEIARLCTAAGALLMVDAVCTLSTTPLQMRDWGIDVVITGGQKGLASIPGVSLIALSDRAWETVCRRPRPMAHWCLDAQRAWGCWGEHTYHYTAPVPGILALYEALRLIAEETLTARHARHRRCQHALEAGLEGVGLEPFVARPHRLRSVMAIKRPEGVDSTSLRQRMARRYGVQIAGAFGHDIVRIGQMGEQCRPRHLFRVLHALGASLHEEGCRVDVAAGMAALERALAEPA